VTDEIEALVGQLRQLLSPPTGFVSGHRVFLPDAHEADASKRVKNRLIDEAHEVLDSPRRWVRKWSIGRSLSEDEINEHVEAGTRDEFHALDGLLQSIYELPRP
jgi:hypothetical protein